MWVNKERKLGPLGERLTYLGRWGADCLKSNAWKWEFFYLANIYFPNNKVYKFTDILCGMELGIVLNYGLILIYVNIYIYFN